MGPGMNVWLHVHVWWVQWKDGASEGKKKDSLVETLTGAKLYPANTDYHCPDHATSYLFSSGVYSKGLLI